MTKLSEKEIEEAKRVALMVAIAPAVLVAFGAAYLVAKLLRPLDDY